MPEKPALLPTPKRFTSAKGVLDYASRMGIKRVLVLSIQDDDPVMFNYGFSMADLNLLLDMCKFQVMLEMNAADATDKHGKAS